MLEIEKTIAIFEIRTLNFFKFQRFVQNLKFLNLGPKMPYLGVLGSIFEKFFVILEISAIELVYWQSLLQR